MASYLKIGTSGQISGSTLDSLGPCFAPCIPDIQLNSLSSNDLITKISYFQGSTFQPNAATTAIFSSKIDSQLSLLTSQTDKENFIFNTLQDTALFATGLSSIISTTTMQTVGNGLLNQVLSSKDTSCSTIQTERLGVGDDSTIQSKIQSLQTFYLQAYSTSGSQIGRKKRAITSLTCQNLYDLSNSLATLDSVTLSTLSTAEFTKCKTFFSTYTWSNNQASTLASILLQTYSSYSSISDNDLAYYSTILTGLSPSDLLSLKFVSLNTIAALGKVNTWSSIQLSALVTAMEGNGNYPSSPDVLNSMKNLACGITSTEWKNLPESVVS